MTLDEDDDDELEEEDDDELEEEDDDELDDDSDDDDDDEIEKVTKAELLEDIAEIVGEGLADAAEVDVKDEDQSILITMNDESVWKLTLRQVKEAP